LHTYFLQTPNFPPSLSLSLSFPSMGTTDTCLLTALANISCDTFNGLGCSECLASAQDLSLNCSWCQPPTGEPRCLSPGKQWNCSNPIYSNSTCPGYTCSFSSSHNILTFPSIIPMATQQRRQR